MSVVRIAQLSLWVVALASLIYAGILQDEILSNKSQAKSATHPVTVRLKGVDFNVTRRQKLEYELCDLALYVSVPFLVLLYFIYPPPKKYKEVNFYNAKKGDEDDEP